MQISTLPLQNHHSNAEKLCKFGYAVSENERVVASKFVILHSHRLSMGNSKINNPLTNHVENYKITVPKPPLLV